MKANLIFAARGAFDFLGVETTEHEDTPLSLINMQIDLWNK